MDKTGAVIKESKDIKELKMKMSKLEQQVSLPSSKNTIEAEKNFFLSKQLNVMNVATFFPRILNLKNTWLISTGAN